MAEKRRIPEIITGICKKVEKKLFEAKNSTKTHYNRKIGGNLKNEMKVTGKDVGNSQDGGDVMMIKN